MFEVLKNRLETSAYTLASATARIDYLVAADKITPEEAATLLAIAKQRAVEEVLTVEALAARLNALEGALMGRIDMIEGGLLEIGEIVYAG